MSLKGFALKALPGSGYFVGCREVKTMLFGKRPVWAIVTKSEKSGQFRLFPCTKNPKELRFDLSSADAKAALFANADVDFLPLTIYGLRWNIEVSYYEQKTFWALGAYRVRSKVGMERLVNLLTLCYSAVKLLIRYANPEARSGGATEPQIQPCSFRPPFFPAYGEERGWNLDDGAELEAYYQRPVQCVLRIWDSAKKRIKERGSDGYFSFVAAFIPPDIEEDGAMDRAVPVKMTGNADEPSVPAEAGRAVRLRIEIPMSGMFCAA